MRLHDPYKKNSAVTTKVTCAIIFWLFSLSWLFWFQSDVLAVAQHVLSGGMTSYNRVAGAVLITFVLQMLQLLVFMAIRLQRRTHALTYFPSMMLLALLTDISPNISRETVGLSYWLWLAPLLLLLWAVVVWFARQLLPFGQDNLPSGFFSRRVWINMLLMVLMMVGVAGLGNTDAVFHYRAHAEVALNKGLYDEALKTGQQSLETDRNLTMLRAYALARKGQLAERLFEYPIAGRGADLLPLPDSRSRLLLLPKDSLFMLCGARPVAITTSSRYLTLLQQDSLATKAAIDYQLCGLLIDRKIDAFARTLLLCYKIDDHLPRHYREALTLYCHLRSHPVVVYHNAVMEADWKDFQKLEKAYPLKSERKGMVFERYRGSYWYYYFYGFQG